jgi:hypothetical protein
LDAALPLLVAVPTQVNVLARGQFDGPLWSTVTSGVSSTVTVVDAE